MGFLSENGMGSREGNPKSGHTLLVQLARQAIASHGELPSGSTHDFGVSGAWGSIRTSKMILSMNLIIAMLSKPLETPKELY